ncbi:lipopolysaccharide assembly LapA domain-containing protein [Planctomycetota bacterium]
MQFQLIVILLVAMVLILVTVQNPNPVTLQFLSWDAEGIPLIVVILISLMAGIIMSSILSLLKQAKLKDKIRSLQREIEELKSPSLVTEEEIEKAEV